MPSTIFVQILLCTSWGCKVYKHVCVSVMSVCSYISKSKSTYQNSTKLSVHVTCGHGSILLWWH